MPNAIGSRLALRLPTAATPSRAQDHAQDRDGEATLIRQARRGSADAAEALVRRHWAGAHRAAYLIIGDAAEAEDIAQEALLAALNALERFDDRRPLGPWLHRVVVNRALDATRARNRRPAPRDPAVIGDREGAVTPDSLFSDEALAAAISDLPLEQRTVVVLRYALGYPTAEIAVLLDLPRGTVGSRLRRALDRLRIDLEGAGDESE